MSDTTADDERLQELLDRWEVARKAGDSPSVEELCAADPDLTPVLREHIDALLEIGSFVDDWELAEPAEPPLQIGPYRVLRELGRGGSAVVYLCQQTNPRRQVALKMLRPARVAGQLGKRFRREIQLLATLNHPGIAQIHDAGTADLGQGPQPYFTMEWIQGQQLNEFARSRQREDRPPQKSVELLLKVCEAVGFAHEHGIIHRDLKPANILVAGDGQPKVLDFGIARIKRHDGETHDPMTVTELALGTPPYMSPEQFAEDARAIDARSDVYSLGVILYELLTGRLPYKIEGTSVVEVGRIVRETAPVPAGRIDRRLRGDLETILSKALAKDPDDRYQSVSALSDDVRHYLASEPIAARRIGAMGQLWRWSRAHPRSALTGAATLATLALACVVSLYFARLAQRHSRDLAVAKSQLERQVQHLRRSVNNSTLMRTSHHTTSDPAMAASVLLDERLCPVNLRGFAFNVLYRQTKREVGRVEAHDGEVVALDVSADGTTLATAGLDGKLRVWRIDSMKEVASFDAGVAVQSRIALDGAGSRLAAIDDEGHVLLASVDPRQITRPPQTGPGQATSVAMSGRGRWLAVGDRAGSVRIWETDLSGPSREFSTGSVPVVAVRFDDEGRRLVAVARDGTVCEWEVESGAPAGRDQMPMANLRHVVIDPTLRGVAATRKFEKSLVWDRLAGQARQEIVQLREPIHAVQVTPSLLLVTASRGHVRTWRSGVRKSTLSVGKGAIRSMAASPRGDLVAVGYAGGAVCLLRVTAPVGMRALTAERGSVSAGEFSPDGKLFASAAANGLVTVHDVQSGEALAQLPGHAPTTMDVLFSRDGRHLVSADSKGVVRLWSVQSGELAGTFDPPQERLNALVLSRDGARLFGAGGGGKLVVFSMRDRRLIKRLEGHTERCSALAVSPDGSILASADERGGLRLWDTSSLEVVASTAAHRQRVNALAFTPDGRLLATGSRDGTIRLWKITSSGLTLFETLRFHTAYVTSLDFSPDGAVLASGGRDARVILWDTATWQPQAVLHDEISWIRAVRFSPDGGLLAVAGNRDFVRLWDGSRVAVPASPR